MNNQKLIEFVAGWLVSRETSLEALLRDSDLMTQILADIEALNQAGKFQIVFRLPAHEHDQTTHLRDTSAEAARATMNRCFPGITIRTITRL